MSIKKLISLASRDKRYDEVDGKDYYFKTKEYIKQLLKEKKLLQYLEFNEQVYGYALDEFEGIDELIIIIGGSGSGKDETFNTIFKLNEKEPLEEFKNTNTGVVFSVPDTVHLFKNYMDTKKQKTHIINIFVEEKERCRRIVLGTILKDKKVLKSIDKNENGEPDIEVLVNDDLKINIKIKSNGEYKFVESDNYFKEIIERTNNRIKRDGSVFNDGMKKLKSKYGKEITTLNTTESTVDEVIESVLTTIQKRRSSKKQKKNKTINVF